jgi:hypothetical protein
MTIFTAAAGLVIASVVVAAHSDAKRPLIPIQSGQ